MIQSAQAKWLAAKETDPAGCCLGRPVNVPANAFTDQMVSVEQMIPLSGKNRSRERAAAAEALGACNRRTR